MTEKRHHVRSAVSPDPCVMFVICKYSCLAPGELSQVVDSMLSIDIHTRLSRAYLALGRLSCNLIARDIAR